jgi:hypothetical protein
VRIPPLAGRSPVFAKDQKPPGGIAIAIGTSDIIEGGWPYRNCPGGLSMSEHRTALVLFAIALAIVFVAASVTTLERVTTHQVSNDAPPGTTGLAKPHPRLDRAPGEPLANVR